MPPTVIIMAPLYVLIRLQKFIKITAFCQNWAPGKDLCYVVYVDTILGNILSKLQVGVEKSLPILDQSSQELSKGFRGKLDTLAIT